MTQHARKEMIDDDLSIYDVEHGLLTGKILERQRDTTTAEWKYRIRKLLKGKCGNDCKTRSFREIGDYYSILTIRIGG
jgi:hypothetical protein